MLQIAFCATNFNMNLIMKRSLLSLSPPSFSPSSSSVYVFLVCISFMSNYFASVCAHCKWLSYTFSRYNKFNCSTVIHHFNLIGKLITMNSLMLTNWNISQQMKLFILHTKNSIKSNISEFIFVKRCYLTISFFINILWTCD